MVRQRNRPGIGWRQACTKAGRKAKHYKAKRQALRQMVRQRDKPGIGAGKHGGMHVKGRQEGKALG